MEKEKVNMQENRCRIERKSKILRTFTKNTAHNERCFKNFSYLCSVNLKIGIIMEKVKRTREEVRAAFRAFMKEREMEQIAAQKRRQRVKQLAEA